MSSPSSSLLSLLSGPPSEMSTPTSQSIAPSQTQTPANEPELVLVQAETKDFYQGAEIYVRGEPCTCIRFDYPLVYYRFPNQPLSVEKHRSFVNDRVMFTVNPATRAQRERTREGLSNQVIYQDVHGDEEREGQHSQVVYEINENAEEAEADEEDDTQRDDYTSTSTSSASSSSSSTEESSRTFPEPGKAKNNLLGAFLNRPKKTIFEKLNDQEVKCDARFPSSALIESCARSTFTFTDKVSSITILNCEDVKVNFQSVIGSFEVIKSKGVNVVCHGSATTYQLDQSQDTVIYFPRSIENQPIYWVTSGTNGTQIVAKDDISSVNVHKSRSDNVDTANDITFELRETRTNEEIEATPDAVQPQWRTIYANNDFTTTPLEREGIGYVKP